jgi:hypothetical protein
MEMDMKMKTVCVLLLAMLGFGCGYSKPTQMTQPGIVPVIASLTPPSQMHGGSDFTLMVSGSSFNSNAVVNWNGAPQTNAAAPTANTLKVTIPASSIAAAGTVMVTVTNPGSSTPGGPYGGGSNTPAETSNAMTFTIN